MKTLLFCFASFVLPGQALACITEPTVQEARKLADTVFIGKVTKVQYMGSSRVFGDQSIVVTFTVFEQFKGTAGRTFKLYTVFSVRSCGGYQFKEGKSYLVYAKKTRAEFWLNSVHPTVRKGSGMPKPDDEIFEMSAGTKELKIAVQDLKVLSARKK